MTIAHVVRHYGGVTEPFIQQRVAASGPEAILWFERSLLSSAGRMRRIRVPLISAGTPGDRIFHLIPGIGPPLAGGYSEAETRDKPSVIHAHYLTTGYMVGSRTRAPLVVSAYGFDVSVMPRRRLWKRAIRALVSRAALVCVEGPHMRDAVKQLGFSTDCVAVVPIAIDLSEIAYHVPQQTDGPLRLMSCGRLVEKKGHDSAIMAFARLLPTLPRGSCLEIVGDGPLRTALGALAAALGVQDRVTFHGTMQRPAYLRLLETCDLLVAASRTARNGDSEGGAPTSILDAQATGVIAVGSDHADLPYLIQHEVTGFVARRGSPNSIADAISHAVAESGRWPSVAQAAYDQVLARHSPVALKHRLEKLYGWVAR